MKRALIILTCAAFLSGCGTGFAFANGGIRQPYSGVMVDLSHSGDLNWIRVLMLFDLPLSAIADTACLPLTLTLKAFYKPSEEE